MKTEVKKSKKKKTKGDLQFSQVTATFKMPLVEQFQANFKLTGHQTDRAVANYMLLILGVIKKDESK